MKLFVELCAILMVFCGEIGAMEMPEGYRDSQNSSKISLEENNIYAEAVADYTWKGEGNSKNGKFWSFVINFIAEEVEENASSGEFSESHMIELRYLVPLRRLEKINGYKSGIKPLEHQKIKIKYEKEEPIMFSRLESLKCQDGQGQIVELDF